MRIKVFVILLCLVMVIFMVNMWTKISIYEQYLSEQVYNDYLNLSNKILLNNSIYEGIIEKNQVKYSDIKMLIEFNDDLSLFYQDYAHLASRFKRLNKGSLNSYYRSEGREIAFYFQRLLNKFEKDYEQGLREITMDTGFELEEEDLYVMRLINELNENWATVILENVKGTLKETHTQGSPYVDLEIYYKNYWGRALSDSYWIDVIVGINDTTLKFLGEHRFDPVSNWLKKFE